MSRLVAFLALFAVVLLAQAPGAMAQDGDDAPAPVDSEEVDREEAEFRRRMELEEGRGDDRALPPPSSPDIVDVLPAPGPLDHLPPESREHLEDQLTELIIANGRWEPADAQRPAPYTPSAAAQADPALQAAEQAAWEDMVAAYHKREQAALAGAGGSGNGTGQGSGAGGDGAGEGGTGGQGSGNGAGASPGSRTPEERAPREPQDEAFNALEFLRQQAAGGDQPPPAPATSQSPEPATSQSPEPAMEPGSESGLEAAAEAEAKPSPAAPQAPDGSLPADALEALFPADAGDDSAPDPEPAPASGSGESMDGETAGPEPSDESGEPPASQQKPPADAPPPAPAEPPRTGFLAWLRGLFSLSQ